MKRRRATVRRNRSGYGFDYGIGITVGTVGSIEFNKNLIESEVIAVAYGVDYSKELMLSVPTITLVGRNEESLRKAFDEFSVWAEATDGDAIELTIVFAKDGGYRLCINPETGALYKRLLQYDSVVNPFAFQLTWIKPLHTTSQPLKDLRAYLSAGTVRPFLLQASRYTGLLVEGSQPIPELFVPISSRKELLKFEIRFVDEGSKDDLSWQRLALKGDPTVEKPDKKRPTMPKALVSERRQESLKRLFPVTLWRSRTVEEAVEVRRAAQRYGLSEWQIDQAICNLVLSQEIGEGEPHFRGCAKRNWPDLLWKTLCNRFEVAGIDRIGFDRITVEDVIDQTLLDGGILLKYYGIKHAGQTLERTQQLLKKASLLDAPGT